MASVTQVHANPFMSISAKSILQLTNSAGIEISDSHFRLGCQNLDVFKTEKYTEKEKLSKS